MSQRGAGLLGGRRFRADRVGPGQVAAGEDVPPGTLTILFTKLPCLTRAWWDILLNSTVLQSRVVLVDVGGWRLNVVILRCVLFTNILDPIEGANLDRRVSVYAGRKPEDSYGEKETA